METVEFNRPIRIVTSTTLVTHTGYYTPRNSHTITVNMPEAGIYYELSENISVTVPTEDPDEHIMEFTLPDLGVTGVAALELVADGMMLNFLDVEVVAPTGETQPITITL